MLSSRHRTASVAVAVSAAAAVKTIHSIPHPVPSREWERLKVQDINAAKQIAGDTTRRKINLLCKQKEGGLLCKPLRARRSGVITVFVSFSQVPVYAVQDYGQSLQNHSVEQFALHNNCLYTIQDIY